ncbi:dihydroorotase [soil metagenome]
MPGGQSMSTIVLRGGRVIDPDYGIDQMLDVLVVDGRILSVGESVAKGTGVDRDYDVTGLIVTPGWIDAHVHLRDPGFTYKEDLQSGAKAALAGGFTRMCCMPNTDPPLDSAAAISDIVDRGEQTGVHIHPIGTISMSRAGLEISPIEAMAAAGAIGFSDDGDSTKSEDVMRDALRLSSRLNLPIMVHCEDPELARGGSMHRGAVSEELGDRGIPADAEDSYTARDIRLAEETGGWLHVLHVSTVRGAQMVKDAKQRGARVTAEIMPHHLTLTDEWVAGRRRFAGQQQISDLGRIDPNAKVNPPLRSEQDALGLMDYVLDGTFDFIATDHAPHAERDKPAILTEAASGMTGLELAIPTMALLIKMGRIDWPLVVRLFTSAPARSLNLNGGALEAGHAADITVIDPAKSWTVTAASLHSRSKNTPLLGMTLKGRAVLTLVSGEVRHDELS